MLKIIAEVVSVERENLNKLVRLMWKAVLSDESTVDVLQDHIVVDPLATDDDIVQAIKARKHQLRQYFDKLQEPDLGINSLTGQHIAVDDE